MINQKASLEATKASTENNINPFEKNQSAKREIEQSAEEIENEQQFKEAPTERD